MGTPLRFPQDTDDPIERLWWETIRVKWSSYAPVWEKYIGKRRAAGRLLPYQLVFPAGMSSGDKDVLDEVYLELALAHYSAFCEVAGAFRQRAQILFVEKFPVSDERAFGLVESYNSFYNHLGTARNMAYRMWAMSELLSSASGKVPPKKRDGKIDGEGGKGFFQKVLAGVSSANARSLEKIWTTVEEQIVRIRNLHIHAFSGYFIEAPTGLEVFIDAEESRLRFMGFANPPFSEPLLVRLDRHLNQVQELLSGSDSFIDPTLVSALNGRGVKVGY